MAKETRNTSKKVWIVRIATIILLIIGLGVIFNSQIRGLMVRQNQTTASKKLNRETIKKNQTKRGMFDFSKVEEINFRKVIKSGVNNTADAVGAITVPNVKMYLPIVKGLSNDAMSTGSGTMRSDQVMRKGNYPLAGHYMTTKGVLFSPLEDTKLGEEVCLTNLDRVYVYRIYVKEVVGPTAVWLVDNIKRNIVALITYTGGSINRRAIRGKLIAEKPAADKNLQVSRLK